MNAGYFTLDGTQLVPDPRAHSPWATDMLHGRLLGGLAARVIENEFVEEGWRVSRLTVDLFRPAAMKPVQILTSTVRMGRRVRVIDALVECDGHQVGRVSAVVLATSEEPPGTIWRPVAEPWPDPESMPPPSDSTGEADDDGWLFRVAHGGFDSAMQSRVWTNETVPLVAGETMSPLVRSAVSGDIACPLANSSNQGLFYINADYTMFVARYPVGDWIGIEVSQQLQADGLSIASATLVDCDGPFATSSGTSLTRPPLPQDT
ncbi:MAG: hypothetical protein ACI9TF_001438 [Paracrocinitomix sp.]|jgi:hypothetical protein